MHEFDGAVVGAGMAGTAFALAAARQGWHVVVLEKEPSPRRLVRPEILWNASMAALGELGVGERVRQEAAVPVVLVEVRDARTQNVLLSIDHVVMTASGAAPWATDPTRMREVLLAEAVATGRVTHRPGWRAEGVVWDEARRQVVGVRGHGPEGAFEVRVPFVVGDDGARSVVRADADIGLEAEPFPMEFILASVARPASLRPGEARVFLHPADWGRDGALPLVFVAPVSAHRVALVAIAPHGTFGHHERAQGGAFAEALTRTVPPDVLPIGDVPAFPQAWVRTVRPVGHAPRYWRPGLALVGDAIHPVSPVGGQGANMALADARALAAAVLGATNRGQVPPPDALARYEAARRAANDHGVAFSRRAGPVFEALQRRPWLVHGVVPALRAFNASPAAKARGLAAVSSAFASGPAGRSARPGKP